MTLGASGRGDRGGWVGGGGGPGSLNDNPTECYVLLTGVNLALSSSAISTGS